MAELTLLHLFKHIYVIELKLKNSGGMAAAREPNYHKPILGTFQGRQAKSDRACCRIG